MESNKQRLQSILDFRDGGGPYTKVRTVELPDGSYVNTFVIEQDWFDVYSLNYLTKILGEFRYTVSLQEGAIQFFVEE